LFKILILFYKCRIFLFFNPYLFFNLIISHIHWFIIIDILLIIINIFYYYFYFMYTVLTFDNNGIILSEFSNSNEEKRKAID